MLATEAARSVMALEAAHTSDPALDAAMVLFKAIVQVGTRPVPDYWMVNPPSMTRFSPLIIPAAPLAR